MRHLLFLFVCDLLLILKRKIKSFSYGLVIDIALLVECLAPGQNCIKCNICTIKFLLKGNLLLLCAVALGVTENKK